MGNFLVKLILQPKTELFNILYGKCRSRFILQSEHEYENENECENEFETVDPIVTVNYLCARDDGLMIISTSKLGVISLKLHQGHIGNLGLQIHSLQM